MNTILVIGGTGRQGSGVVDGILKILPKTHIRTISRNKSSNAAVELSNKGVEIIEGNLEDDSVLQQALKGVDGVFLNLDYWTLGESKEIELGKLITDHSKKAGVKAIIYSTLEKVSQITNGKYNVPYYDGKGIIEDYIRNSGIPCAFVKMATYMECFKEGHVKLEKDADGVWMFKFPLGQQGWNLVPVHDVGRVTATMFSRFDEYKGRSIGLAGDHLSGEQMAATFEKVVGEKAKFVNQSIDEVPPSSAWRFYLEYESLLADYVNQTRSVVPDTLTFAQWLKENWSKQQ